MKDLDKKTPGGVYLCQVNDSISCGACCGLYNVAEPSYNSLYNMLHKRTELFARTPRDYDSLVKFEKTVIEMEDNTRPYPEFHHCRYIGLIGDHMSRPGCLLHPLGKGNNNVDHRGLSHWGGFACASYFCPTCSLLPARYKEIVRLCAENWHIYGLVVTETEMLKKYFSLIESSAEKILEPDLFRNNSPVSKEVADFFRLKLNWPFREPEFQRYGNYFFKDNLYPRDEIPFREPGSPSRDFDIIFKALGSSFKDPSEAGQAGAMLSALIDSAVNSL